VPKVTRQMGLGAKLITDRGVNVNQKGNKTPKDGQRWGPKEENA